ncbi:hypothetical protein EAS62_09385 [Bradyrhizobium zhanjiangense]|uniref:Uncharacterized protein n=1 Tax=Bradyrhizobium zhanjiangense TaxID=1325107 RepID=A0ABY0DQ93_9BRAD|nr:hypothetical protein EAS62_09385 [Bradyrhizobium zhanjiangense]
MSFSTSEPSSTSRPSHKLSRLIGAPRRHAIGEGIACWYPVARRGLCPETMSLSGLHLGRGIPPGERSCVHQRSFKQCCFWRLQAGSRAHMR